MIISNKHKLIFIEVPKTGSSSIAISLLGHLKGVKRFGSEKVDIHKDEWELRGIDKNLSKTFGLKGALQHLPAMKIRNMIGEKEWDKYFTFAFVRNPWEQRVSAYFFLRKKAESSEYVYDYAMHTASLDFKEWVVKNPSTGFMEKIADGSGNIIVDFVGKTESIQQDFDKICQKTGMPKIKVPHRNRSRHEDYTKYYNRRTMEKVLNANREIITRFRYQFSKAFNEKSMSNSIKNLRVLIKDQERDLP